MNLQLSLKKKWFEMTKQGIKTEDYREITNYWCDRLLSIKMRGVDEERMKDSKLYSVITNNLDILQLEIGGFKLFETNTMTLGYPKSDNKERMLKLKHKGIEIRKGNPEWGAEPDKYYFVIMHGSRLNEA